jgi:recombination protein RecT
MADTTVSKAAEHQAQGAALVRRYSGNFAEVLPSHIKPETFVRLALGLLARNPQLAAVANQNPGSYLTALLDAARLGLEPGDTYHLIPFGGREPAVVGVVDYKGEIELIYRAGAVSSVKAELVYTGDKFEFEPAMDKPIHEVDWFGDRGQLVGVYAYANMRDGSTSKVIVLGQKHIDRVKAVSRGSDKGDSPWQKWPESMWLKTAVHQLQKWVPTSAEYCREQLRAAAEIANQTRASAQQLPPHDPTTGEIHDAEVVDPPVDESAAPPFSKDTEETT